MLFINAFVVGLGLTLGVEVALGWCYALKVVIRSKKNERT